ncbi:MAG: aminotransferase class V-fold PLP-dependent enzyme [Deltaproteobacteria bacterium]|nr:aminotransferase class V-fold PLP-dependent enzyme [Deltaproteobacteria bacterium]
MIFLTPGPTKNHIELSNWLEQALEDRIPSRHHRSDWFKELFANVREKLLRLAGMPPTYQMFLYGCASEIWERALESVVENKVFFLATGEFGHRWLFCARNMNFSVLSIEGDSNFVSSVADAITEPVDTICLVHGETAIGMIIPENEIRKIKQKFPDAVLVLDCVSTFPISPFDYGLADVVIFSVQKCFCLPSGLGVALVSHKTRERVEKVFANKARGKSGFASFKYEFTFADQNMTPATPNVLGLWLLDQVLSKYLEAGLDDLRHKTAVKANFATDLAKKLGFRSLIKDPAWRSDTVLTFATNEFCVASLKRELEKYNIFIGTGFGSLSDTVIRLGNFPAHTNDDYSAFYEACLHILEQSG